MLMKLSHVIVFCSDIKRSISFYRDQLGFPVKFESPDWVEFHTGTTTLALHHGKPSSGGKWLGGEKESGQAHPSFEVLDLDKLYGEKKAIGVEFSLPPTMMEFGQKLAVALDPDGLPISFTEEAR